MTVKRGTESADLPLRGASVFEILRQCSSGYAHLTVAPSAKKPTAELRKA